MAEEGSLTSFDTTDFYCLITLEVMEDPVVAEDGNTYEREAIQNWLQINPSSPTSREPMSNTLTPNRNLKGAIEAYRNAVEQHRQRREEEEQHMRQEQERSMFGAVTDPVPYVALSEHPKQPSSLRTIRPEAVAAVDSLTNVVAGIEWQPPQIVIIGGENQGKSTVLERLLGLPLFPRDKALCTRVPIRVQLRRGPSRVPVIACRLVGEEQEAAAQIPSNSDADMAGATAGMENVEHQRMDLLLESVRKRMKNILDALNEQSSESHGVSLDHEIVIRLQHPTYPEMDLVDLPGLVAVGHSDDPQMPQRTKNLTARYLDNHGEHSMFLVVLDSRYAMNQSPAVQMVEERELLGSCLGILTKCDLVVPEEDDDDDDDGVLVRIFNEKLNPEAPGHVSLGFGWYLVASRGLKTSENEPYVEKLEKVQQREAQRFRQFKGLHPVWGIERLCKRVCQSYSQYLYKQWAPRALERLVEKQDAVKAQVRALGVPFAHPDNVDVSAFGAAVLGAGALQEHLDEHVRQQLATACNYSEVCENWLLETLHPLRLVLHRAAPTQRSPGSAGRSLSSMPFHGSFAAVRRGRQRFHDYCESIERVLATLRETMQQSVHPVAEVVVAALNRADQTEWRLDRFTTLHDELRRHLTEGLQEWTEACLQAVESAQRWLERGSTNASTGNPDHADARFVAHLGLQEPYVQGMYNAVLTICVYAFDEKVSAPQLPGEISTADANTEERLQLLSSVAEMQAARTRLEQLLGPHEP